MGAKQNKVVFGQGISKEAREAGRKVKSVCKRQWNKLIGYYDDFMNSIDSKCEGFKKEERSAYQILDDMQEDLYLLGDLLESRPYTRPSREEAIKILRRGVIGGNMEGLDVGQILRELGYEE